MSEEKTKILEMLSNGKITVEEADKLLNAVGNEKMLEQKNVPTDNTGSKFMYINVEPKEGKSSERVNVKIPFALMKAGLNIAGLIPKEAQDKINEKMSDKGMSFNLSDLKPENVKELMDSLEEFTVDVDSDDSIVKIFCK